jgi:hypothetical protein
MARKELDCDKMNSYVILFDIETDKPVARIRLVRTGKPNSELLSV